MSQWRDYRRASGEKCFQSARKHTADSLLFCRKRSRGLGLFLCLFVDLLMKCRREVSSIKTIHVWQCGKSLEDSSIIPGRVVLRRKRSSTHKQVQITGTLTFKGCCFFLEVIVLKMLVLYYIHHFIIPGKNIHNSILTVEGSLKLDVGQLPRT